MVRRFHCVTSAEACFDGLSQKKCGFDFTKNCSLLSDCAIHKGCVVVPSD